MSLFQWGNFTLHGGDTSWWRIDCDSFTDSEVELLAALMQEKVGEYDHVACPVSHPGSAAPRLVKALARSVRNRNDALRSPVLLVVDDVLTTGTSMADAAAEAEDVYGVHTAVGAVIFARGKCPEWITPLFRMDQCD